MICWPGSAVPYSGSVGTALADHTPATPGTSVRSVAGAAPRSSNRYTPLTGHHGNTSAPTLTRGAAATSDTAYTPRSTAGSRYGIRPPFCNATAKSLNGVSPAMSEKKYVIA